MSYVRAIDCSQWNGQIDWNAVKSSGVEIAILKVSGSDAGDYVDSRASINYDGARNAGLAFGTYHFAGGTDPRHEAEFFVNVCSPLDENQVLILDWEAQHSDPVGWCNIFVDRVHELTGIWPIIYMNGSTRNAYNWDVVTSKCGVWIAWYDRNPDLDLPVQGTYIMHQYTSSGSVPGVSGRVDLDAWYGTVEQFSKYGYHAPAPGPHPDPVIPVPQPETPPAPVPAPEPTATSKPDPGPTPVPPAVPTEPPKKLPVTSIIRKMIVTFIEAAGAYLSVTGFNVGIKVLVTGAVGSGLSAAYNVWQHYKS